MKFSNLVISLVASVASVEASARYVLYADQYHLKGLPNSTVTKGITHVIMAFENSSLFTTSPPGNYTPFEPLSAMPTNSTRASYASNIASMLDTMGFDGVDIDWEYPGGNGQDYKQSPNFEKSIKSAIGEKELSIAVPGLQRDMIAYTAKQAPKIWESVDFVNIMTYDLMNRRDNITVHHTSVNGSAVVIDHCLNVLGLPPAKANLGFAFYAKYFTQDPAGHCENGLGCTMVALENKDGSDSGKSAAMTFETANYVSSVGNLTESPDGSCGPSVGHFCSTGNCCGAYGFRGSSSDYCGTNCLSDYGNCTAVSATTLFRSAMANGTTDEDAGAEYYYDSANNVFWTWDTPQLIAKKFTLIVKSRHLGGVIAWSGGEDSYSWSHLLALQSGVAAMGSCENL
ncbi:putative glycosyl hydrolase, family 18 [Amylocarpus encephaloides]|uniref:chitinase n=1 Tax=Amylocarpus encephaloides TaxID=45428 RepID=A0A9P8C770_9HELO|nr:putative glycosyl hydrolase, family 18 [Amylocarpus encephaloides]